MKNLALLLFSFLLTQSIWGQSGNCSCSCDYQIKYDPSLSGKEMKLSSYKFEDIKPKEASKWQEKLAFKGNDPILVSDEGLSKILDKVCSKKSKGTLLVEVKKEADDYVKLILGYTK